MSKTFDPKQQVVLDSVSKRQLVSASAGSGKTTVMIQKITDILLNNLATTDEILVVIILIQLLPLSVPIILTEKKLKEKSL